MHNAWVSMSLGKSTPDINKYDENILFRQSKRLDDGICMLRFAVREAFQESLGFSPFELIFEHSVGGPLWKKNDFVKILLFVYYIMWSSLGISLQEHVK